MPEVELLLIRREGDKLIRLDTKEIVSKQSVTYPIGNSIEVVHNPNESSMKMIHKGSEVISNALVLCDELSKGPYNKLYNAYFGKIITK